MPFVNDEKINNSNKLSLQMSGTANLAPGPKWWYNEQQSWSPVIPPTKLWDGFTAIPGASDVAAADAAVVAFPSLLEKRAIRLTLDPTSNNRAYEARQTYGDRSTDFYENWIQPALIRNSGNMSVGYIIRLFNGDPGAGGTEIPTTQWSGAFGAPSWQFNYSTGIITVSTDQSANYAAIDAGAGLWIEGYRYIGSTGGGGVSITSIARVGALTVDGAINLIDTDLALYTVPALTYPQRVKITAVNRNSGSAATIRIAHIDGALGAVSNEDYIWYDIALLDNESKWLEIDGLLPTDTILVRSDTIDVNFIATSVVSPEDNGLSRVAATTVVADTDTALITTAGVSYEECSIIVCNRSALAATYRFALIDGAVGALADEDYIVYGEAIAANESIHFGETFHLPNGYTLAVRASTANVNFILYGKQV